MWLYGIVFVAGSFITLIILLNMVIAVMSMSLEESVVSQSALVYREKLTECVNNYHRLPKHFTKKFEKNKQLYVLDVDPQLDLETYAAAAESGEDANYERLRKQMLELMLKGGGSNSQSFKGSDEE